MGPYAAMAAVRRRRLVDGGGEGGGEGGSESEGDAAVRSTGSHCSGQATPFSVSPRLMGKHNLIRFSGCAQGTRATQGLLLQLSACECGD
eukprot:scaffold57474_cov54-Phaeocystis_antarctica.AAC.1